MAGKKNKTKIQPTGTSPTSPEDVPDELVVKEPCMKKCCRSIVTPRHCAKRMCEGKKINHWSFFPIVLIVFLIPFCLVFYAHLQRHQGSIGSRSKGAGVDWNPCKNNSIGGKFEIRIVDRLFIEYSLNSILLRVYIPHVVYTPIYL